MMSKLDKEVGKSLAPVIKYDSPIRTVKVCWYPTPIDGDTLLLYADSKF
jgi:hypothetical protein